MSVAGGGSICVIPEMFAGLDCGGFLSSTGGCKTFQDGADGYCRGEGVGVVILKRLEDALRENDKVRRSDRVDPSQSLLQVLLKTEYIVVPPCYYLIIRQVISTTETSHQIS